MGSIRKKYRTMPVTIKATFWFVVCSFLQKAMASITTPIFTRLMSTEEYGEYSVYISIVNILVIVATFNINGVVAIKGFSKYPNNQKQFISIIQFISSWGIILFFTIYILNRNFWNQLTGFSTVIMILMLGQMLVMPAFEIWSAKERFEYQYKNILKFTIAYLLCNTFIGILAVKAASSKGQARIISFCIVQIIFYGYLFIKNITIKKGSWDWEIGKFVICFNGPLILQGLANQILSRSDIFMIHYFEGMAKAGIYSLGYSIALTITILTSSINNSYIPWLYKKMDNREWGTIKTITNYMIVGIVSLVSLIIFIIPEIVYIFAPAEYYAAVYVIAPVIVGIAFTMIYSLFVNIELYYEKTGLVMSGSVIVAITNIILNAMLIPRYGFIAAAYTTLISYILYCIMHYYCAKKVCTKKVKISEIYNIRLIFILSVIQLVVLFMGIKFYPYMWMRYGIVVGIILISIFIIMRYRKRIRTNG